MENRRIKMKPYVLKTKILNILRVFNTATFKGLVIAVEGNYSIHTIRKELPLLEKEGLICSERDENKNKVYRLTEEGEEYLKEIRKNSGGYEEADYNNILLRWSSSVEEGRIGFEYKSVGIDAIKMNKNNEFIALIIEKKDDSLSDLLDRIEQAKNMKIQLEDGRKSFEKIYVVTFYPEREREILSIMGTESENSRTKIELYKFE